MAGKKQGTPETRFWAKVDRSDPDGCWPWLASRLPAGYGMLHFRDDKREYAHRIAYKLLVGPIPDDMTIDHLCKNTGCCNPAHMEVVTIKENVQRSNSPTAINSRKTHCDHGHPFEGDNVYMWRGRRCCRTCRNERLALYKAAHPDRVTASSRKKEDRRQRERRANPVPKGKKLTWEIVCEIREKYANGARQCDLAREYHVSDGEMSRLVRFENWLTPTRYKDLSPDRFDQ